MQYEMASFLKQAD